MKRNYPFKKFVTPLLITLVIVMVSLGIAQEREKDLTPPGMVFSEEEEANPEENALVEQLKYYRSVGDTENASKVLRELISFTGDNFDPGLNLKTNSIVVWDGEYQESKNTRDQSGAQWYSSDTPVMTTYNHEKCPTIETRAGVTYTPDIYIAGEEWNGTSNPSKIKLRRSDNHGESWPSGYQAIISGSYPLALPKMKQVSNQYMGIVFNEQYSSTDHDIYFARINGTNFSDNAVVTIDTSINHHVRPAITSDHSEYPTIPYIYVVYYEISGSSGSLIFRMSDNNGSSWSSPQTIATFTPGNSYCSIDFESDVLYVAYTYNQGTSDGIAVVKSSNYGSSWSAPTVIASSSKNEWYPEITASTGSRAFVAYEYHYSSSDRDIYYSYTTNGVSWSTGNILVNSTADERYPAVRAFDPDWSTNVYMAYAKLPTQVIVSETTYTSPTGWSSGLNVKNSPYNVSNDDIVALLPKYTPSGDAGVCVAWPEMVGSDYDIYFDAEWFASCTPPGAFSYLSPTNGSTGVSTSADLDWSNSSGATSYDVYFGTSSNPPYVANVITSYYDPGTLAASTQYYWKIVAKNSCDTLAGGIWNFTTTCTAPSTPANPSPADGATGVSTETNLDWGTCSGATSYDVYFGTSPSPSYVATVTSSDYNLGPLIPGTGYYWKIVAKNTCGSTSGPVWGFTTASMSPRTWTFMVYLDADNDLEAAGIDDFLEMATVGSDINVNIVVQFDRISGYDTSYDNWTDTKRYYITSGLTPTNANALMNLGEVNMGHPSTLIDFVNWTKSHYPASRYALILWDHGSGWRILEEEPTIFKSVCSDHTSGDVLYMDEVQSALNSCGGAQLIGFDACLMGMVEVAYEIRSHGEVMVGSEEVEPADGWPYDTILDDLTTHPTLSSSQLGSYIVLRYYESYGNSYTQSAIDLSQMNTLASTISSFAQAMIDNWNTNPNAVTSAADNVMNAISNAVIREEHGASWPGANGLAIYFPETSGQFDPDYNGTIIDFPAATQWEEFLQEFYSSMGGSWIADARDASQEFYLAAHVDLYNFCENINSHCPPPGAFSYISPSNGATGLPLDTDLDWSNSSGATSYDVYFGTSPTPPKVGTVTGSYYDPGTLNYDTTYHWKIAAKSSCGETPGPVWSFTTTACTLPGTPTNPYPPDGSTLCAGPNYNLTWSPCSNATSYDVYFGTSPTPPKVGTVTDTIYNVGVLAPGTYWWRIAAKNSCGETPGPYWSFTILSPPAAFTYISPSNGAAGLPLDTDLDWNDSSGATSYDVYFGISSSPPYYGNTTSSFYNLPQLQCGTHYYWKIVAKNACGDTPGAVWDFTTENCVTPYISSLNPWWGPVGTPVTISGSNFGSTQGTVTFNGVNATINSWTESQIETVVPSGASTGPVVVHTAVGQDSNGVTFTVTFFPPGSQADLNGDGNVDVLWRYYGDGGYNAVWLRGTATAQVSGTFSEKTKNSAGVVDMEKLKPKEETGEVTAKADIAMSLSIQELRKRGIKDGFEEYNTAAVDKSKPLIDPFDFKSKPGQAVSHIMASTVSDPRDDPEAVELPAAVNTDWKLCGTGDFNGDGKPDLVWRNVGNGNNAVWFMDGVTKTSVGWFPATTNLDWTLCGIGDFNGDGKPDLVWRNVNNGNNVVWFMDGLTRIGVGWLPTTVNLDWVLCGTGDFNNDGKTDLVWRNVSNGNNVVWFMDGVTMTSVGWLPPTANLDWTLCGTGDFNNDGKMDLLWRNVSSGNNAIWYMDGLIRIGVELLTTVTDTTWKIEN